MHAFTRAKVGNIGLVANYYSFYVWSIEQAAKPLVLVRYEQFAQLLKEINARFRKNKPLDPKEYFWRMTKHVINDFPDHPRFLPRYLGYCDSKDGSEELIRKTPSRILKYNGEPEPKKAPTDEQRDDFMDIYETAIDLGKGKSKGSKKKERETRVLMQAEISKTLKRAQRYLGLRSKKSMSSTELVTISIIANALLGIKTGLTYEQHQQEDAASYMPPVNPSQPAPYTFENDVIIICVDVEAWERDHKIITEAGFATLDTRDLVGLAPGEGGKNWMEKIRARHFRVQEYLQYVNSDFVQGNPDRFEFGKSELVALKNTPHTIATCFKEPFSKLPTEEDIAESYEKIVEGKEETDEMEQNVEEKRKIVFLGHNPSSDISFLRQVGYDVLNLSNLLETWDTAALYRAHKREPNAKSVGNILAELGLEGWNLHNAGNDAVYTMWILIATCIQAATGRGLKADVSSDDGEAVNGNTGDASNGAATNAKVVTPSKPSQPGKPQEAEVVANEEYQNW